MQPDYRFLLDSLGDAVVTVDASGCVVYANPAVARVLGWRPDELVGRPSANLVPPFLRERHRASLHRWALRRGAALRHRTIRLIAPCLCKNGRQIDAELSISLVRFRDGWVFVAILRDIRTRSRRDERTEAARMRDELLFSISHDLKNPLATVTGQAQLLQKRVEALATEEGRPIVRGLRSIETASRRMNYMINDLVDTAYLRIGRPLHLHPSMIDLVALAQQVSADVAGMGEPHPMDVTSDVTTLPIEADEARLVRMLGALLSNAVKFSPAGTEIRVHVAHGDEAAVLSVHDSGPGIPKEDMPHVFERFYRGSNAVERVEGQGLGLSSARQIVDQHGGRIDLSSENGRGTTVTVTLPLREP